ncbi:MAG: hypothetical protein ACREOD_05075 [Candidatus Dormibacteria bacterium]
MRNPDGGPTLAPTYDEDEVELERLRLQWLALVGPSRAAQRVSHTEVAAWAAWTRWQVAKSRLEARRLGLGAGVVASAHAPHGG